MGKVVLALACIVLFTLLLPSAILGEEHIQVVERELREARDKPKGVAKTKGKKSSGGRKRKDKKSNINVNKKISKKNIVSKEKKISQKDRKFSKKNQKKNGNPKTRNSKDGCSRQTSATFCPAEKAMSMKLLYNQVYNFRKQLKRAQNHASIVKKKKDKKDNFQKDAAIITDVVGGNLTDPSCSTRSRSSSEAASTGSTLSQCSTTIASSCEDVSINSTLTGSCSTTMDTFDSKVTSCKDGDSCTCWTEALAMKADITKCNALDEANSVKAKKKTCLSTFSDCKKAQDSSVEYTSTCPSMTNSITTMTLTTGSTATTKSAIRRGLVEKFLARNIMRRDNNLIKD